MLHDLQFVRGRFSDELEIGPGRVRIQIGQLLTDELESLLLPRISSSMRCTGLITSVYTCHRVGREWKRPRTRVHELRRRGLDETRARASAYNGRGPWWNAGASHMHAAVPTALLRQLGLLSLLEQYQRLVRAS